jgi:hypothetical protein
VDWTTKCSHRAHRLLDVYQSISWCKDIWAIEVDYYIGLGENADTMQSGRWNDWITLLKFRNRMNLCEKVGNSEKSSKALKIQNEQ